MDSFPFDLDLPILQTECAELLRTVHMTVRQQKLSVALENCDDLEDVNDDEHKDATLA